MGRRRREETAGETGSLRSGDRGPWTCDFVMSNCNIIVVVRLVAVEFFINAHLED
jgi:hypothetical protein